jgi:hypothetical protein
VRGYGIMCVMWVLNKCEPKEATKFVATPLWGSCEVATHTPKNGTWESFGTPEN